MQLFHNQEDVMIFVGAIMISLLTMHLFKLLFNHDELRGSPRYTWYHGVINQIGILQYFALVAWYNKPEHIHNKEWLFMTWDQSYETSYDRKADIYWFIAFLGIYHSIPLALYIMIFHYLPLSLSLFSLFFSFYKQHIC